MRSGEIEGTTTMRPVSQRFLTIAQLLERGEKLPYAFPTETNRIRTLLLRQDGNGGATRDGNRGQPTDRHPLASKIEWCANNTHVTIHRAVFQLCEDFLELKKRCGTNVERAVYRELEGDARALISQRLLRKRPLTFMYASDYYKLKSGEEGSGGFETIGTEREREPLAMRDFQTYDEMQLSALLTVCSPTILINDGSRSNCAVERKDDEDDVGRFERYGYYVAQVGARFERPGVMEYRYAVIHRRWNTRERGYGRTISSASSSEETGRDDDDVSSLLLRLYAKLYGIEYFPTFEEAQVEALKEANANKSVSSSNSASSPSKSASSPSKTTTIPRFLELVPNESFFDTLVYRRMMRIRAETFFLEANRCASLETSRMDRERVASDTMEDEQPQVVQAYCHVVGLGLGVWRAAGSIQSDLFAEAFLEALEEGCRNEALGNIAVVDFSHIRVTSASRLAEKIATLKREYGVEVRFSSREPFAGIEHSINRVQAGNDRGRGKRYVVVANFAWDSNAYPGNEFWIGSLDGSGDPAAMCCSLLGEIQNVDVNAEFPDRIELVSYM